MRKTDLLKPKRLAVNDVIGLVSPGSSLAAKVPHRRENAVNALQDLGFKVKVGECALNDLGYISDTAENRAQDIHDMFLDPDVRAVMTFIGGFHYHQVLPYLDFELIKANPKIFVGYSDATVMQLALLTKANLVTYSGPAALTQFGEFPKVQPYTLDSFKRVLMSADVIGEVTPAEYYTDEVLNWFDKSDITRARKMKPNHGLSWLQPGHATGPIIGGCLPSMLHLRGTEFWPDFSGAILLLEDPEGSDFTKGRDLSMIDMDLTDLKLSGVFDQVSGVVVGRLFAQEDAVTHDFEDLLRSYTEHRDIPVVCNADFGHTDPIITIPLGTTVELDSESKSIKFLDAGVS